MNEMNIYPIYPKMNLSKRMQQAKNSDQGCQFTSQQYIDFSFKYEEAYLTQYNNIREARAAIGHYIHTYNFERRHSALDYQTPAECYYPAMLLPYVA